MQPMIVPYFYVAKGDNYKGNSEVNDSLYYKSNCKIFYGVNCFVLQICKICFLDTCEICSFGFL